MLQRLQRPGLLRLQHPVQGMRRQHVVPFDLLKIPQQQIHVLSPTRVRQPPRRLVRQRPRQLHLPGPSQHHHVHKLRPPRQYRLKRLPDRKPHQPVIFLQARPDQCPQNPETQFLIDRRFPAHRIRSRHQPPQRHRHLIPHRRHRMPRQFIQQIRRPQPRLHKPSALPAHQPRSPTSRNPPIQHMLRQRIPPAASHVPHPAKTQRRRQPIPQYRISRPKRLP